MKTNQKKKRLKLVILKGGFGIGLEIQICQSDEATVIIHFKRNWGLPTNWTIQK
jgi:hypothetical protein